MHFAASPFRPPDCNNPRAKALLAGFFFFLRREEGKDTFLLPCLSKKKSIHVSGTKQIRALWVYITHKLYTHTCVCVRASLTVLGYSHFD